MASSNFCFLSSPPLGTSAQSHRRPLRKCEPYMLTFSPHLEQSPGSAPSRECVPLFQCPDQSLFIAPLAPGAATPPNVNRIEKKNLFLVRDCACVPVKRDFGDVLTGCALALWAHALLKSSPISIVLSDPDLCEKRACSPTHGDPPLYSSPRYSIVEHDGGRRHGIAAATPRPCRSAREQHLFRVQELDLCACSCGIPAVSAPA